MFLESWSLDMALELKKITKTSCVKSASLDLTRIKLKIFNQTSLLIIFTFILWYISLTLIYDSLWKPFENLKNRCCLNSSALVKIKLIPFIIGLIIICYSNLVYLTNLVLIGFLKVFWMWEIYAINLGFLVSKYLKFAL